jgi:hypothetical protein
MRIVAVVLGALLLAGTILLVIAGASAGPRHSNAMGPLAFLLCIVAVAAMIVLGVTLGGRNNPRRAPHSATRPAGQSVGPSTVASTGASTGEMAAGQVDTDQPGDTA